jgi:DeoR family glycerol-3-phosphate regulon repressor
LRSDNGAAFGVSAIDFVSHFNVTHSVISAGAVDAVGGIMDFDLEEAEFARMVISRGRRSVAVTDHSKFGRQGLVKVCGFSEITEIVTEQAPPTDVAEALDRGSVLLTLATPDAKEAAE